MILLSEAIFNLGCPASVPTIQEPAFDIGCRMVGSDFPAVDAAEHTEIAQQARAMGNMRGFIKPLEPSSIAWDGVVNDLFIPGSYVDVDKILHIHFPVPISLPLSSTSLARDWRFLSLAAWVKTKPDIRKLVLTAWDAAGRKVMAMVEPDVLESFPAVFALARGTQERPGALCVRCSRAGHCAGLGSFLESHSLGSQVIKTTDRAVRTTKLFAERVGLQTSIENLEARRKEVDKELHRLAVDGKLNMGVGEPLKLPQRQFNHWDFYRVKRILETEGLWEDNFGTIKSTALQAAFDKFPDRIKAKLQEACVLEKREPSISEAASHARFESRAPIFTGLSGKSKRMV